MTIMMMIIIIIIIIIIYGEEKSKNCHLPFYEPFLPFCCYFCFPWSQIPREQWFSEHFHSLSFLSREKPSFTPIQSSPIYIYTMGSTTKEVQLEFLLFRIGRSFNALTDSSVWRQHGPLTSIVDRSNISICVTIPSSNQFPKLPDRRWW